MNCTECQQNCEHIDDDNKECCFCSETKPCKSCWHSCMGEKPIECDMCGSYPVCNNICCCVCEEKDENDWCEDCAESMDEYSKNDTIYK